MLAFRGRGRWSGGSVRSAAAATLLWSSIALAFLIFDPWSDIYWSIMSQPPFLCSRLVGRSAACDVALQSANEAWAWLHLYPLFAFIALGYIAIAVVALRGRRRPG